MIKWFKKRKKSPPSEEPTQAPDEAPIETGGDEGEEGAAEQEPEPARAGEPAEDVGQGTG